ncbi:sigma-70 family RNA polymerase sigma factor [Mucilaginibacter sp. HC2]|uniref:RNA polymerase sigma factor n=1 Tax=Mucilaginibacter inviolabilis TaxID=2714892 RepID=UPI001408AD62|nr:sigma-70 family RNA polymerase sigma factor [Mucilaginibacter inviolabilis]NHA02979.1 sigma-70 family RNA polymerase sigma factor [Mucilaginibacter inviolabilis]
MIYINLSEQLLLNRCSDGDTAAFQELYHRYKEFVFNIVCLRLASKEDARDVTQDIFITLWTNREQLRNLNDFKLYLYVFSRNQVVSAYRKKNTQIKGENYLIGKIEEMAHSAEEYRFARELTDHIDQLVVQLPETMRSCYNLSKNEGKKNGEIADILNISEKTVRNNVSEALKRLRLNLRNSHPELLILTIVLSFKAIFSVILTTILKR